MRVTLLNAYDSGGAGTATKRIHRGLRQIDIDSRMIVDHKENDDPYVYGPESAVRTAYSMARPFVDDLPLHLYWGSEGVFSVNWLPDDINRRINRLDPDLVHLNWVGGGFFSVKSIDKIDQPIVWRLPDMWAFTGGCHYSDGCERYTDSCGTCPRLNSDHTWDLSRWIWKRKAKSFSSSDITVAAPSSWLAECARESSLLGDCRIEVVPNGLDTETFKPYDRTTARDAFDLPEDKRIVLFGAMNATSDPRKGFDLLQDALTELEDTFHGDDIELVVFGSSRPEDPPEFVFPITYTGYLNDEVSLALLYAAADVMIVPSRYEGFGQTVTESMSCGTPVVAFDATGPSDTVNHKQTGYLAEPYESTDLARGIKWVLDDSERQSNLSDAAREKACEEYGLEVAARRYRDLYESVLKNR